MLAARAGAAKVYACEMFDQMAAIARHVTSASTAPESGVRNVFGEPMCNITVFPCKSSEVTVHEDGPSASAPHVMLEKADMVVSEILDSALLGEAGGDDAVDPTVIWVYNAVTAEHAKTSDERVAEVESLLRLEAAREAEWDEASIESSRPDGNGYLVLAFQEGGGVGSADSGRNAADAAAQCASRLNGRTFEERELFVRYAPLS